MRRNELDEMQLQKRNMIGNQSFMLLFYLLMIDIGLYGFGFRWLQYPINVFIIMLACMTYYLICIIWHSSYVGPHKSIKKHTRRTAVLTGAAGLVAGVTAFLTQKYYVKVPMNGDDNSAIILIVFSIVMIIIVAGVSIIAKRQNRNS